MVFKSCRFIEHGIYFKADTNGTLTLKHCCNMDAAPENEQYILQKGYNGGEIDWQKILETKRQHRNECRSGKFNPHCEKCWELQEKEWDNEDYFSEITFAHIIRCNSRCVYCYIGNDEHLYSSKLEHNMLPIIQGLQEKNLLKFTGSLRYMGGEPTLMKDFEEITDLFVANNVPEIYLPTSGIRFSKAMERACKTVPFCQIFISIDSGSPETYEKIKGLNAYDVVLDSLRKYAAQRQIKGHVISKYIFVPKINDNTTEIDKWISDSKKIGLTNIAPDAEYSCVFDKQKEKYLKHLLNLLNYAETKIKESEMVMDESVVYRKILQQWGKDYKEKLENDTPNGIKTINLSNADDIENTLQNIIDENSIWNKPAIELVSDGEITECKNFEKALYDCFSQGFNTIVKTNAMKKSKMIEEALKIAEIKLFADVNGEFANHYKSLAKEKVLFVE